MKEPTKKQIESATKSWDGIDTQEFMDEIRRDNIHTIDLTDGQARQAAEGTLTEIRVEIEGLREGLTSAIEGKDEATDAPNGIWLFLPTCETVTCPFAIGDTIRGRETWDNVPVIKNAFLYKTDVERLFPSSPFRPDTTDWQPASTMPDDAIRHRFTVQSVGAEQEGEKWYWVLGVGDEQEQSK